MIDVALPIRGCGPCGAGISLEMNQVMLVTVLAAVK